jgi:meso-butanediol dehydrogenase / (S,S)-butanediol dehydrogenase / diacetyl reductase
MLLEGKKILVTGAGRGIGRAIALQLAREGASLAIVDIDGRLAQSTAGEVTGLGRMAVAITADTTSRPQVQQMIENAVQALGSLDVAFNNAGVGHNSAFLDLTDEQWDRQFQVNTKGAFVCTQEKARHMVSQGHGGKIINSASIAGRQASAYHAHYSASKFAVIGLTQAAAKALAIYGITVNAMSPGIIDTQMWRSTTRERATILQQETGRAFGEEEFNRGIVQGIPLGRIGQPEDVAGLAVFLASPYSDYITGQTINVCGGFQMI